MRALLIEDDRSTAQAMELMLKAKGFSVYTTDLGEEGVDLAKVYEYDVILLDLNLPDMHGLDVLRVIRLAKVSTPVIIVSGEHRIEVKVKAFSLGADDYVTKPFHADELSARMSAVVRRMGGHISNVVKFGAVEVDLGGKTVRVNGANVHLTGKEYGIVELLTLRPGQTLTKDAFLNHLYGGMDEPELKIIDVFICKLRKKLEAAGAGKHIQTVWGRGYVLRMDLTEPQPVAAPEAKPKPDQKADAISSKVGKFLCLLADGPASPRELARPLRMRVPYVAAMAQRQVARGLVMNRGKPRDSLYALTDVGVSWLETQGYPVPPAGRTASSTATSIGTAVTAAMQALERSRAGGVMSNESAA